jgi:hypothetical protein
MRSERMINAGPTPMTSESWHLRDPVSGKLTMLPAHLHDRWQRASISPVKAAPRVHLHDADQINNDCSHPSKAEEVSGLRDRSDRFAWSN